MLSRRWLLAWLIVLAYMAAAAWYARDRSLTGLSSQLTAQLRPYAEQGIENPPGTYPSDDYVWDCQGPMVYLIERGYRDPGMLRVMLLCEARRCYDRVYLYDRCLNWDLRTHLIEECLGAFPDDPLVHWAAGRCLLTGGEYGRAADELLRAEQLGFDAEAAGVSPEHLAGRIEAALIMAGRVEDAIGWRRLRCEVSALSADARFSYAELLTELERYSASDTVIAEWRAALGDDFRQHTLGLRNAWWRGDLDEFQRRAWVAAEAVDDFVLLDWAGTRLALLNGDDGFAREIAGDRYEMYCRARAETYAQTGRAQLLLELRNEAERQEKLRDEAVTAGESWDRRSAASHKLGIIEANVLRAYLLTGQWDAALAIVDQPRWEGYAPELTGTYDFARTVIELSGLHDFAMDWQQYIVRDRLPMLLNSRVFADAAADGGHDPEAARRLVLSELTVERGTYHDCSNGELDW